MAKFSLGSTVYPLNTGVLGTATHDSNYGVGGLKTFPSREDFYTIAPERHATGSIAYSTEDDKYYMYTLSGESMGWTELSALTTGAPNFASGITVGGYGVNITGGGLNVEGTSSLGNVTKGTWSATTIDVTHGGTNKSFWVQYGIVYASKTDTLNQLTDRTAGKVLINSDTNPSWSENLYLTGNIANHPGKTSSLSGLTGSTGLTAIEGDIKANAGNLSASAYSYAGSGFSSSVGYLRIGGAATASTGFYSPGTSNLATLTVTTISSSGLATLTDLYVPGNTQLGNATTDTTSVFGTLSIVNNGSTSGSITSDASGNLILDGSGVSSGV